MSRSLKFWALMGVFQVAFGFAVFAITRDYYKPEAATVAGSDSPGTTTADRFSSIDPSLVLSLGNDAAFPQDPAEISRQANELFANGQYARAVDLYEKLLSIDPGNVDTWNNLGLTLHYVGRSQEALLKLNEGVTVDSSYQRIWLTLGFVNSSVGNTKEAREALSTAASMDPNSDVGRSAARMLDELTGS